MRDGITVGCRPSPADRQPTPWGSVVVGVLPTTDASRRPGDGRAAHTPSRVVTAAPEPLMPARAPRPELATILHVEVVELRLPSGSKM